MNTVSYRTVLVDSLTVEAGEQQAQRLSHIMVYVDGKFKLANPLSRARPFLTLILDKRESCEGCASFQESV